MTDSLLLPTDVGAAISLREMAYSCEGDALSADRARTLETLTARGLQLASGLERAWSLATADDTVWERGAYRRRVQAIDFLATVVVDILARTQEILASTRAKRPELAAPQGAAEVDSCLQTVRRTAAAVRETLNWLDRPRPPVREEMLRRSRESLDRGEGEPMSDLIARLNGGGPLVRD